EKNGKAAYDAVCCPVADSEGKARSKYDRPAAFFQGRSPLQRLPDMCNTFFRFLSPGSGTILLRALV
ncbi:TPA: hypothetical protein ACWLVK_005969, partial [Klebsiella michiganensis]